MTYSTYAHTCRLSENLKKVCVMRATQMANAENAKNMKTITYTWGGHMRPIETTV